MNKRLVYHYWDGGSEIIQRLHFALLKRYAHIFDEIIFIVSTDRMDETEHLQEIHHKIINIGFKGDITILNRKNDSNLRESLTFKEQIVDKLNEIDGITLFAHSRGGSIDYIKPEYMYHMITFLYYGCLNWMNEVEMKLKDDPRILAYGGIKQKKTNSGADDFPLCRYKWWFQGTFQWLNTRKIYQHAKNEQIEIPHLTDRYYGETGFLPNMFSEKRVTNHSDSVAVNANGHYYDDTLYLIKDTIGNDEEYERYLSFFTEIIKETIGEIYEH